MKKTSILILLILITLSGNIVAKSVPKAMLLSAILPGTGELYAGDLTRGVFFLTTDLVILFNVNRFGDQTKMLEGNFKKYAYAKANIPLDSSTDYYNLIHRWQSSDEYNAYYEMVARNYFLIQNNDPDGFNEYITSHHYYGDTAWNWQNDRNWKQYKEIRRDRNTMIMNRKLAIGAAIANRVISVMDARYIIRAGNKKLNASFNVSPLPSLNGAQINCQLEF